MTTRGEAAAPAGGAVAYTGVAFTADGLAVGHAALRWNDDDIELQRVYVTPPHRCSGTAAALLAAAEEAARALHVRRIVLRPGDQQPGGSAAAGSFFGTSSRTGGMTWGGG